MNSTESVSHQNFVIPAKAGTQGLRVFGRWSPCSCQGQALGPRFRARACTHLAAKVSLSALGGGEGRGEVGEPARSQRRHGPPHPPAATAPGPSLSPRKRAERAKGSR